MTYLVPRTCAVIGEDDFRGGTENASRPLEFFRETDAYVLLGAPGAGKTEAFKLEAEHSGGYYVTARDFITFDDKPEWRGTTLFIDGLDEARAGSSDGRTPFDRIRAKLDRLGRPTFRLSCREADWFGPIDRDCLQTVSRDGKVTDLRLDPISENDIREILHRNYGIEDTDGFVASARERGVDTLLTNPQSLKMLVKAVTADGIWPETRLKTFDLACQTLLREFNRTHRIANRDRFDIPRLMDAAGRLCALQLLTGGAGYTGDGGDSDHDYPGLETIPGEDRGILRHVLGTRVFEWVDERRAAPVHRQIAEFLGARYLAGLIDDGLPAGRVLALMTGNDGVVVSELRGLAAWLAAHGKSSRQEIIARDPLGTVLYGDVLEFSTDEKRRVLACLEREAKRNPWLIAGIQLDSRLGDIVTPDMDAHFREILAVPARDDARQAFIVIVIEMLAHGPALPGLADPMMGIVRDATWWPRIRRRALNAFIGSRRDRDNGIAELDRLLSDIDAGAVPDPNDDLLGCLLTELYPERLSTPEVLRYLRTPKAASYFGMYEAFWTWRIRKKSTNAQLAELLDTIVLQFNELKPVFGGLPGQLNLLHRVLFRLLQCALETSQEDITPKRLFNWLGVASDSELQSSEADSEFLRSWLEGHPAILKKIIKLCVEDCVGSKNFRHCIYRMRDRFYGVKPPDYGQWCLEQAVAATDRTTASYFLGEALDAKYGEKQQRHLMEKRIAGHVVLESMYREIQKTREERERPQDSYEKVRKEREAQKNRIQRERHDLYKPHQAALRQNGAPPALLHTLAKMYFGFVDVSGNTPRVRLENLFGDDDDLIAAVLEGFRGAIWRSDVPTDAEIVDLSTRNRAHYLALPILAGLEEAVQKAPDGALFPDEKRMHLALAIHYALPTPVGAGRPPNWFPALLASRPDAVGDVLIRSATSMMRCGADYVPGLHELLSEDHAAVARLATLPLLKAFPVRCKASQIPILSDLFRAALLHCETESFLELIDKKLAHRSLNVAQRVYWLAAGLLFSPELYLNRLESYVASNERRIRHLAAFLTDNDLSPRLTEGFDAPVLRVLIRLIGGSYRPFSRYLKSDGSDSEEGGVVTPAMFAGSSVEAYINQLAAIPSAIATDALEELASDDNLRAWRSLLIDAAYRQNAARREAGFRHCDFGQVLDTLDNRKSANAADLAALTIENLREISRNIRDGNTSDWRQYWNAESPHRLGDPRPENWCRDALLSDLQTMLTPLDIDAQAEAHYADAKRSDIRVSYGGFNVPVEIKRSCSSDLWSAIGTQLVAQYARDPGADGHGIYLVFWFGNTERCRPTPGEGKRPRNAADLEERLRGTLTASQLCKISICVIDVSAPENEEYQELNGKTVSPLWKKIGRIDVEKSQ